MTIGVTGAFGFLGASVVARLLAEPLPGQRRIVAFASSRFASPLFDASLVEIRRIDISDSRKLAGAFDGIDAMLHFAGKVGFSKREKRSVWEANVGGAFNVFNECLRAGTSLVINISSVSALGPAPEGMDGACSRGLVESDRPYGKGAKAWSFGSREEALAAACRGFAGDFGFLDKVRCVYLDSKLASLELAHELRDRLDLPVMNLLPGTAIGPGGAHTGIRELLDAMISGKSPLLLPGVCSYMDSRDFAGGVRSAMLRGKPGQDYILAGTPENNLSFIGLAKKAAAIGGTGESGRAKNRLSVAAPRRLALPIAALAESLFPASGLSMGLVESGCVKAPCDCGKAARELGYDPSTPLEKSILDCLAPAGGA